MSVSVMNDSNISKPYQFSRKAEKMNKSNMQQHLWSGLKINCIYLLPILVCIITASTHCADEFPVLDILKGNVTFWKKIYSEVSLHEGLLHDREYPMIIYEKLELQIRSEKERTDFIDSRKKHFTNVLDSINTLPVSQLSPEQSAVRQMFEQHASVEAISSAKDRIRFQLGQKERFREGIERSSLYLDTISAIFKKFGLPEQLKYLPHVESSFDYEAYSRVGAAGLWQFMRGTGRMYLTVNYDIDERWDPVKSTEAAAKLLKLNYQTLKSWPVAITAYNHGLGGMKRAVEKSGSNDLGVIIQKHESPSFKFASKNFYASFLAASEIAASAEKYFTTLNMHSSQALKNFTITERITPESLCKKLGLNLSEFKTANPAIRPVVYAQKKTLPVGYTIRIPLELPQTKIEQLAKNNRMPQDEPVAATGYYTVKHGDNLHSISRRFSTTVSQLTSANSISNVNKLHVGQVLRLPASGIPIQTDTLTTTTIQKSDTCASTSNVTTLVTKPKPDTLDSCSSAQTENAEGAIASFADSTAVSQDKYSDLQLFNANIYDLGLEILPGASSASIRVHTGESVSRYAEWMSITENFASTQ